MLFTKSTSSALKTFSGASSLFHSTESGQTVYRVRLMKDLYDRYGLDTFNLIESAVALKLPLKQVIAMYLELIDQGLLEKVGRRLKLSSEFMYLYFDRFNQNEESFECFLDS